MSLLFELNGETRNGKCWKWKDSLGNGQIHEKKTCYLSVGINFGKGWIGGGVVAILMIDHWMCRSNSSCTQTFSHLQLNLLLFLLFVLHDNVIWASQCWTEEDLLSMCSWQMGKKKHMAHDVQQVNSKPGILQQTFLSVSLTTKNWCFLLLLVSWEI